MSIYGMPAAGIEATKTQRYRKEQLSMTKDILSKKNKLEVGLQRRLQR